MDQQMIHTIKFSSLTESDNRFEVIRSQKGLGAALRRHEVCIRKFTNKRLNFNFNWCRFTIWIFRSR